ncbi:MAG TPA: LysM peptidoglycan-binding domain-containing protein [Anaerolineae bacterium]
MKKVLIVALIAVAAVLFTVASPSQALAAGPAYHVVQPGQNLSGIATMYGVSAWSMAMANGLSNWNYIYVGQVLVVPSGGGYPTYTAHYLYPTYPQPYQPQTYYPHQTYGCYYYVRYGDTMYGIAARYRGDAWSIARANGIYNLNWIYAGQRLLIPGCN